jgi:hypothetical protein
LLAHDGAAPPRALENAAAEFVERQLARCPDFLRVPLALSIRSVDVLARARFGTAFVQLPPFEQREALALARASRLGPVRDAVRFVESLAIFVREGANGA